MLGLNVILNEVYTYVVARISTAFFFSFALRSTTVLSFRLRAGSSFLSEASKSIRKALSSVK